VSLLLVFRVLVDQLVHQSESVFARCFAASLQVELEVIHTRRTCQKLLDVWFVFWQFCQNLQRSSLYVGWFLLVNFLQDVEDLDGAQFLQLRLRKHAFEGRIVFLGLLE